jgi:ABC-2 type transport system permease protein
MSALATLTKTQSKVFLREPMAVFFGFVFPALLLVVIGLVFPGATEPTPDLGGRSLVEIYAPIAIALGLATVAFSILPPVLGGDRERGVLRRFSTTPVHPRALVASHLIVQFVVVTIASLAAILIGLLVFDIAFPESPGWFALSFVLGAFALLALGLLIGAVVPTASSGQGIGMIFYFPLLFFAGVYIPIQVMPQGVQTVSSYTPSGAAARALSDSWVGTVPDTSDLLVMAAYAVIAGALAIWLFRWD